MEADNAQVPGGRLKRALGRAASRLRQVDPRVRRAAAVSAAALVLLAGYSAFSALSPRLGQWSRAWEPGGPAPLSDVLRRPSPVGEGEAATGAGRAPVDGLPAATPEAEQGAAPDPSRFVWPVEGDVIRGFGWGYDDTMGDYRYHPGVDIAAAPGARVQAAYGGTVGEVRRDGRLGWVVEVTHAPGIVTRYAGLGRVEVARGQVVAPGDPIGTVGDVPAEAGMPSHLHFELIWDGNPADPARVLGGGS